jgi:AMP nucleosidase
MAIDMETATIFIVGFVNKIPSGALLLVSDQPMIASGVKTQESDEFVKKQFTEIHLKIGVEALSDILREGRSVKHLRWDE